MTTPPPNKPQILSDEEMERKFDELMAAFIKSCEHRKEPRKYAPNPSFHIVIQKKDWDVWITKDGVNVAYLRAWITPDGQEHYDNSFTSDGMR